MKKNSPPHRLRASTMTDMLIVVATLVLLGFVLVPIVTRPRMSRRNQCVANLKWLGVAFRLWPSGSSDIFPFARSTNDGGTLEFAGSTNVFLHFRAISNELSTPKILICPSDSGKKSAKDFNKFDNRNISYFIGLDAAEGQPWTILSGDRNLTTNGVALGNGVFTLTTNNTMGWTGAIHNNNGTNGGNIGLADGSVQQVSQATFQKQWLAVTNAIRRLAIP